ncbi:MAG TPA: HNH endonuclease signature motif containing protein [Labilithrix sp.]|nr:HNH endonuclease signature motif containing protein [Labilithrix sp.]
MKQMGELTDEELLAAIRESLGQERRWVARVVAYLAEVERRRIHLQSACSSLFDFCRRRLGMSVGEAFRRMTAARLVQRFPKILDSLARGEVHLSAVVLLKERSHGELESKRPHLSRHVPRSVRQAVFARDGEQCTFTDDDGRRCPSRAFLELDHVTSRALGGDHEVVNLRVRCRLCRARHNLHYAESLIMPRELARAWI